MPSLTEEQMQQVDEITGTNGPHFPEEDVYKVTFPRTEVPVTVDGGPFQPFQGMTSWAAFSPVAEGVVMGDLAAFEDEVSPVRSAALDNGLEVTVLRTHFLHDKPRLMVMHVGGRGPMDRLAGAVRKALDAIAAVRQDSPNPSEIFSGAPVPGDNAITPDPLDAILGAKGSVNNGTYKVTIGRTAQMHGIEFGTQMGLNTWAAFAGEDDGDSATLESEVQPVLKALRVAGIHVVAIHNHMTHDQRRYVFLRYWGRAGPRNWFAICTQRWTCCATEGKA